MLLRAKAQTQAARFVCADCALSIDMARSTGDEKWIDRAAAMTPIAKSFGSETGVEVSLLGIAVHGGAGFVEETGASQFLRDVLVTTIYEGTNGIQAMDLAGRKLADGGEAIWRMLDEVTATAKALHEVDASLSANLGEAARAVAGTVDWMVRQQNLTERFAGAAPFLRSLALVLGAHYHGRACLGSNGSGARAQMARVFFNRLLPGHAGLCAEAVSGSSDLYARASD